MEMLRDDVHRLADGSIDYNFYRASADGLRREERKRVIRAAVAAVFKLVREAPAAALRAVSMPGKLGGASR